jgi:hypothetical protein
VLGSEYAMAEAAVSEAVERLGRVERVEVRAYKLPTETPQESDGTLVWDSTTIVIVELLCGGHTGLGYTYCSPAAAAVIR